MIPSSWTSLLLLPAAFAAAIEPSAITHARDSSLAPRSGVGPATGTLIPYVVENHRAERAPSTVDADYRLYNNGPDQYFTIDFLIGSPPLDRPLRLNAARSYLKLGSYQPWDNSKTYKKLNSSAEPDPGEGSPKVYASEKVTIGGKDTRDMEFWTGGQLGLEFFGVGFSGEGRPSTWHQQSASWQEKEIGLYISHRRTHARVRDSAEKFTRYNDSEIRLGGLDRSKMKNNMTYYSFTPDPANGAFTVPLNGININGTAIDLSNTPGNSSTAPKGANSTTPTSNAAAQPSKRADAQNSSVRATIDLMSDVITVPDSVAQRIYQKFPGARNVNQISRWVAPCEYLQNQNMTVSLNIGGDVYPIDTSDMGSLSGDKISDDDARRYGLDDKVMSYCTGIFASGPQYSLGTSFLHYVYTSLRYDPPAVGFTPLAPGGAVLKDPMETPKSSATTQVSKSLSFMVAGAAAAALLL